jgi:hypothetical protein
MHEKKEANAGIDHISVSVSELFSITEKNGRSEKTISPPSAPAALKDFRLFIVIGITLFLPVFISEKNQVLSGC